MKKVMIVSYYYPPRPGVGTNRIGGIAKYLPQFGWEAFVVTPALETGKWAPYARIVETEFCSSIDKVKKIFGLKTGIGFQQQLGLNKKGPGGLIAYGMHLIKEILCYPDEFWTWIGNGTKAGVELAGREDITAIISSSSPVSSHIIAANISKACAIPWVADFRDLWTQNHYYQYTFLRRVLERNLEIRTMKKSAGLITVSEPLARTLQELHSSKQVYCITNGFDPEEAAEGVDSNHIFSIIYTGSLYGLKRNPEPVLAALRNLINKGFMEIDKIRLEFYGQFSDELQKLILKHGLEHVAMQQGVVERAICLEKQRKASVLLMLNWDNPDEEGVYTGKIFEYLAAKRPILAVGGMGGVVKELLDTSRAGVFASSEDEVEKAFVHWYKEFMDYGSVVYQGKREEVDKYSHVRMAEKFGAVLDRITGSC